MHWYFDKKEAKVNQNDKEFQGRHTPQMFLRMFLDLIGIFGGFNIH